MNVRFFRCWIVCVVLLSAGVVVADPFSVAADHQLKITWRGQPLVTGDVLKCIGPGAFQSPEGSRTDQVNGWAVQNIWRVKDKESSVTYRREVAVNEHEVELTMQFRVPAYYQQPKGGSNAYRLDVPLKALAGMTFHAVSGRGDRPRELSGKIAADMPNGSILRGDFSYGQLAAFIAFEKDGRGLIFDFNPKGPAAFNDYGPTTLQGLWRIDKAGNELHFYFGRATESFGGVFNSKVRIVEGTFDDYSKWHAHRSYGYFSELPTIGKPLTMPAGSGDKTLDVDVPQPGIYIFTVRNNLAATAPFTLDCDGQTVAQNVSSAAGKMQTITFSRYTEDKQIQLTWRGKWAASTVVVQALIYKAQDFAFKRGVWLADDIPTPTNLFMFKRTMPPATGWSHVGEFSAASAAHLAVAKVPPGDVNVPSPNDPNRAWRWDGSITGLGPSGFGSLSEFETDQQINRRLDELQHLNYHIILLNGLLFRHSWPAQMPRIEKTVARIVELAHQRGMKVVDHQDLTVLCYKGAGFNQLIDHLDWTQRDVRTGVVTRGWCLNNPDFQKHYWNYITNWMKGTHLDGLMIDEATFHGDMFCGCEYCRDKFHHDTGLYLPYDGKDLMNPNSRLWKLWESWRIKSVGDWWVALRNHLEQVNPHVVIMKYTTNYGLIGSSIEYGASLPESARAADFLGTEIMSRNLYATYRNNIAAREMFNSLRHAFGSPIFGLVYPVGQPVFAYSGWIQNNMRGQVTWTMTGNEAIERDAKRYSNWNDNMDLRHARPVAETAMLFSLPSINFPAFYGHGYAVLGAAEQLDDHHVPYQVILNRDLTPETLKHFKLLILPSDCCMSDAELAVVRNYLTGGGKVLTLGHTGILDELGEARKSWPVGQWIGLKFNYKLADAPITLSGPAIGSAPMPFSKAVMEVTLDTQSPVRPAILAQAQTGGQMYIAIAQGAVGKGTLLVVTPRLGAANCQREITTGETWVYQYDPQIGDLFANMVDRLMGNDSAFSAVQIPSAVRSSLFEQPADDGKTMTLVHLYNGTGVHMNKGEKVPDKQPANPFPALTQDLVFEINLPFDSAVHADIVSPDYTGMRHAKVESLGAKRYRVTVPKEDLVAYSIVRLRGSK